RRVIRRHRRGRAGTENYSGEVADASGALVRCAYRVEEPVVGGVVGSISTYTSPAWERPRVRRSTLRFLDAQPLAAFRSAVRLASDELPGDWTAPAVTAASPELITIARRTPPCGQARRAPTNGWWPWPHAITPCRLSYSPALSPP